MRSAQIVRIDESLGAAVRHARQKIAGRLQENLRRLQLRDMGAARNDLETRLAAAGRQFMRHRRRRRLVMFADQHQHRRPHPAKVGPQIEFGQRVAGGAEHLRVGSQERLAAVAHQFGMLRLEFRREQPAHRRIGDRRQSLGLGGRRHVAERFAARFRERSTAIGENEFAGDAGMADRHLQRDEPAIAIAEHDCLLAAGRIPHGFRHPVGNRGQAAADRRGATETGQFRYDHPKRLRQFGHHRIEAGAIRQQRMQQEQRRAFAELLSIDRAAEQKVGPFRSLFQN